MIIVKLDKKPYFVCEKCGINNFDNPNYVCKNAKFGEVCYVNKKGEIHIETKLVKNNE